METVMLATIALGIIAKFVEMKLEKSTFEKEWLSTDELTEVVYEKNKLNSNFETY